MEKDVNESLKMTCWNVALIIYAYIIYVHIFLTLLLAPSHTQRSFLCPHPPTLLQKTIYYLSQVYQNWATIPEFIIFAPNI